MAPVPVGGDIGATVSDQTDVVAGATHVHADHIAQAGARGRSGGGHHSPGGAGAHGEERAAPDVVRPGHTSRAGSQQELPAEAGVGQRRLEPAQIADDRRPDIGVHQGGRGPLELRWFRVDLVRERNQLHVGVLVHDHLPGASLVLRIQIRVQERNGDRGHAEGTETGGCLAHPFFVQRYVHRPFRSETLGHLEPHAPAGDGWGRFEGGVPDVLFEAAAQLDLVPVALGDDEAGGGTRHLDHGVVGDGGAVDDRLAAFQKRLDVLVVLGHSQPPQALQDAGRLVRRYRRRLLQEEGAIGSQQHAVGEGSTDIDAHTVSLGHDRTVPSAASSDRTVLVASSSTARSIPSRVPVITTP